ncbi:MAG: YfaZ family outer membrane protein [Gammaproteobacteria bacterium]|nr:YfaZ family outer membrane protein [Gammaproteobacteria bacterium]
MRNLIGPARPGLSLLLVAVSSIIGTAAAHEIDLSLNADALRLAYATEVGDGLRIDGGFLTESDEGDVVHAGLQVVGDAAPGNQKLTAGLGGRLAYLDGDGSKREGYALGLGGSVRWPVPRYNRFVVSGELYFAPDILAGGDAEEYVDGTVRVGYSVTRRAEVYVGARYLSADYDDRPSIKFDTGVHAGLNLRF